MTTKIGCLITALTFSLMGCTKTATETASQTPWQDGHPAPAEAIAMKCATCHVSTRPTITVSKAETTSNGRSYTVHFHNLTPIGFAEDPGAYNDCSTCHTHAAGWSGGNFGPAGTAHLTDSLGNQVSMCTDCHDYPADFWHSEHTTAQSQGFDCVVCHLSPDDVGGTKPGGFGGL